MAGKRLGGWLTAPADSAPRCRRCALLRPRLPAGCLQRQWHSGAGGCQVQRVRWGGQPAGRQARHQLPVECISIAISCVAERVDEGVPQRSTHKPPHLPCAHAALPGPPRIPPVSLPPCRQGQHSHPRGPERPVPRGPRRCQRGGTGGGTAAPAAPRRQCHQRHRRGRRRRGQRHRGRRGKRHRRRQRCRRRSSWQRNSRCRRRRCHCRRRRQRHLR